MDEPRSLGDQVQNTVSLTTGAAEAMANGTMDSFEHKDHILDCNMIVLLLNQKLGEYPEFARYRRIERIFGHSFRRGYIQLFPFIDPAEACGCTFSQCYAKILMNAL